MARLDDLSDENTENVDSVLTTTNCIAALAHYPVDTPIVLTFMGPEGALSEHGLEILAIVDNERESPATVVAFVIDPSDVPFHIPTAFPADE